MPRDIERGRAAGFSEYLTKPIDVAEFIGMLDRCLLPEHKEKEA
jgi:CheY-like chemotaxis protein